MYPSVGNICVTEIFKTDADLLQTPIQSDNPIQILNHIRLDIWFVDHRSLRYMKYEINK